MKHANKAESAKIISLIKNYTLGLSSLIFSSFAFAATPLQEPNTVIIGNKHESTISSCRTTYSYTEVTQNNGLMVFSFAPMKVSANNGTDYFMEFYTFSLDITEKVTHFNASALKLEIDGIKMTFPLMNELKGKYVYLPSAKSKNSTSPTKWIHMNKDVFAKVLKAKTIKYEILIDPKMSSRKSISGIIQDKGSIFHKFKNDCSISIST